MLSDEEKKVIEQIIKKSKEEYLDDVDYNVSFLLNLIEKQSKEIEELKRIIKENTILVKSENGDYQELNINIENYIHKAKIKAKIEELDKEEREKLRGTKGQDRYAIKQEYMHKRSILQSLLEKE